LGCFFIVGLKMYERVVR